MSITLLQLMVVIAWLILNLTVNYSSFSDHQVLACDIYEWNGALYTESGEYEFNTVTVNGCDSVAYLNLTIINVSSVSSIVSENISATSVFIDWDNASPTGVYDL